MACAVGTKEPSQQTVGLDSEAILLIYNPADFAILNAISQLPQAEMQPHLPLLTVQQCQKLHTQGSTAKRCLGLLAPGTKAPSPILVQQLLRIQLRHLLQLAPQLAYHHYTATIRLHLLHDCVVRCRVLCLQVAGCSNCAAAEILEVLHGALPLKALHLQLLQSARLLPAAA